MTHNNDRRVRPRVEVGLRRVEPDLAVVLGCYHHRLKVATVLKCC